MGSVSRRRWRRGAWGALDPTNGMALWTWLLAAVLLSLLSVSVARPRLTATKEEEATLGPEGKRRGRGMQCVTTRGLVRFVSTTAKFLPIFVKIKGTSVCGRQTFWKFSNFMQSDLKKQNLRCEKCRTYSRETNISSHLSVTKIPGK